MECGMNDMVCLLACVFIGKLPWRSLNGDLPEYWNETGWLAIVYALQVAILNRFRLDPVWGWPGHAPQQQLPAMQWYLQSSTNFWCWDQSRGRTYAQRAVSLHTGGCQHWHTRQHDLLGYTGPWLVLHVHTGWHGTWSMSRWTSTRSTVLQTT